MLMSLLHLAAIYFFYPALFITIPAHIIINIQKDKKRDTHEKKNIRNKIEYIFYFVFILTAIIIVYISI